jgi:hypothetical protein
MQPLPPSAEEGIIETSTVGISEFRQLVGSDPGNSLGIPYLRVPSLASPSRYLFLLAYVYVPENERIAIVDFRQGVDIGQDIGNKSGREAPTTFYPNTLPVTTDDWSFSDANVSFHATRVGPATLSPYIAGSVDADCFRFRVTDAPGLLYATATLADPRFYTTATAYTPPNGGQPYGQPLTTDLATWYDLRFPRNSKHGLSRYSRDIIVDGECGVALWASVKQTDLSKRPKPAAPPFDPTAGAPTGITPEEAFLINNPDAIYWGVRGAILWRRLGPSRVI